MSIYVVIGATGHTGKPIALELLEKKHTVRIVSRHADKAVELIQKGANHFAGDSTDVAFLTKVFAGADELYTLIPFDAVRLISQRCKHSMFKRFHKLLKDQV